MKRLIATLALAAFALTTTVVFAKDDAKSTTKTAKTKKAKAKKTTEEKK